jgi:hypothetical protein
MSRRLKITAIVLLLFVIIGAFYFPRLRERVVRLRQADRTEEQARREVTQPTVTTPTDVKVTAKLYFASAVAPATLEPVEVQIPLSANPVQRAKQVVGALITSPPTPEQRTLPADATLVEFYLLADGTAVADFSDALATATPSGILSEQLAVDSIVKTMGANVDAIQRLKILIHGQEVETLAGHVDLTGTFPVRAIAAVTPPTKPEPPAPRPSAPGKSPGAGLTPPSAPGKLGR